MKFLKYLIFTLVLVGVLVMVVGLFLPARTEVERSIVINAEPQTVYGLISDLKEFNRWSPWAQNDPNMSVDYPGIIEGMGAVMVWQSEDMGSGRQEIVAAEPYTSIEMALLFGEAMEARNSFDLEPVDEGTRVTWRFTAEHGLNLMQRYVGLVLDEALVRDFEQGLTNLKNLAESLPPVVSEQITYSAGGAELTGYIAMPRNAQNRPAVLVVHEWWGHNQYVRDRADMLAELGHVAFAIDMYGDGKLAEHPDDAKQFMMQVVNNQDVAEARFKAAIAVIKSQPQVDPNKIAAIGYCFGGAVVLSMGRAGADLDAVVSFHGALGGLAPVSEQAQARFLVLNGADDPMVTEEQIEEFKSSMEAAGLDYEFVNYEGAQHGFTVPAATEKGQQFDMPLAYDPEADADSWERMKVFLQETFSN